jgi:hypothetical protein
MPSEDDKQVSLPERDEMKDIIGDVADIRDLKLDLDKDEKLRTVALMLGIRFYGDTIIKDAAYLDRMIRYEEDRERRNDPDIPPFHLRPASVAGVVTAAHEFEQFLRGSSSIVKAITVGGVKLEPERAQGTYETKPKEEEA